jgi:predicted  nucleic acid-binding Zn-ribbon protein
MNTKLILVVALALAVASAQNLQFNVNNLQVAKGSNAWQIGVPCSGAQSNYQYNCNTPANDWQFNNGYFTVPASYTANFGQEYVCNCQVADPLGQVLLQGALTFTWTQSGLSCVNNNWGYVAKAGAVGAAVLSRLGNLAGQISGGLSTGGFSIGGGAVNVFSGLPQCSDIDGYIQKGDCQSIITIVNQTVNGNTLTCDAKIAYLNDILGRICAAITVKKQSVANLTATIAYLTSQIQTITSQISTAQGNLNTLNTNLNQLNANLQNLQNLLSAAIANQSTCNANCAAIKTQINNLNTVIAQIQQYLNSLNSQLTSTTNAYNNYCQQVTDLQNQLAAAIANKNSASQNITILNSAISQWTGYLNGNQTNLNTLNGQYQQCTANCTTITTYINTLKQNITTVQAAIDQATCDSHHLSDNITAWQVTLANLQGQLSNSNILLSTFNTAVSSLQSL